MSLKFGIYLVEQRIISPEQFCGLVKIQQEALKPLPTVALRKNMLTIKQVASILEAQEAAPSKTFTELALDLDYLDPADIGQLEREQQQSRLSIQQLLVECGLLTDRQVAVLSEHFEKVGSKPSVPTAVPTTPMPGVTEIDVNQPATIDPLPHQPLRHGSSPLRQPKFKQRPVIVHPYSSSVD